MITISVGPLPKPTLFYVHEHQLLEIPFFRGALRPDAFLESEQKCVKFEEEDPEIFSRLLEYLYEGDCFPRQVSCISGTTTAFERPLFVRRNVPGSEPEPYSNITGKSNLCQLNVKKMLQRISGIACGAWLPTYGNLHLFELVVRTLCLGDKYGAEDLVQNCLSKLRGFPVGTKEVTVLAKHLLTTIPKSEGRKDVYTFLSNHIRIHRPRLAV